MCILHYVCLLGWKGLESKQILYFGQIRKNLLNRELWQILSDGDHFAYCFVFMYSIFRFNIFLVFSVPHSSFWIGIQIFGEINCRLELEVWWKIFWVIGRDCAIKICCIKGFFAEVKDVFGGSFKWKVNAFEIHSYILLWHLTPP